MFMSFKESNASFPHLSISFRISDDLVMSPKEIDKVGGSKMSVEAHITKISAYTSALSFFTSCTTSCASRALRMTSLSIRVKALLACSWKQYERCLA